MSMEITPMGSMAALELTARPARPMDGIDHTTDVGAPAGRGRAKGAPRTDFSALLALLAGADVPMAPSAGLKSLVGKPSTDESASPAALLDQLLEQVEPSAISSEQTADMLRYGILKDTGASAPAGPTSAERTVAANRAQLTEVLGRLAGRRGAATESGASDAKALEALMALMARANTATAAGGKPVTDPAALLSQLLDGGFGGAEPTDNPSAALLGATGRRGSAETARVNDVLGRIVGRRGGALGSKETLAALGLGGEAGNDELRAGLEALLARANAANANAANAAANAASTAASMAASAAASTTTAVRDTDALAPELQQKLGRVVQRMKSEFGHDVTVVETVRTQLRQDALYEQGRTQPGAVVTWTRDSAHTRGEAVDVQIDGAYTNAQGFARLQQIAAEEGLRTLGPRDPGHLELGNTSRGATSGIAAGMTTVAPMTVAMMQGPAGMAQVAGVAGVAGRAGVAGVAQAASVGRGMNAMPSMNAGAASLAPNTGRSTGGNDQGTMGETNRDDSALGSLLRRSGRRAPSTDDRTGTLAPSGTTATPLISTPTGVVPPTGPAAVSSAERVSDLQALRDSAPAGTVSRLTMTVDAADGGQDRITIGMRGSAIDTHISTDASSAEQMRLRTGALQEALGRQGLDGDTVRISAGARTERPDAARSVFADREAVAAALAQQSASGDGSGFQGQRERSSAAREWDRQDNPRQSRDARTNDREAARDGEGRRTRRDTNNQDDA